MVHRTLTIDHIAYDAYGNVTSESDASDGDQFKFDGMVWDAALGLYYDNARYYDATIGRFIGQDPSGYEAGDADLYRFVSNWPTNGTDPSGLNGFWDSPFGAGLGAFGDGLGNMGVGLGHTVYDVVALPIDLIGTSISTNWTPQSYYGTGTEQAMQDGTSWYQLSGEAGLNGVTFGLYGLGKTGVEWYNTGDPTSFQQSVGPFAVGVGLGYAGQRFGQPASKAPRQGINCFPPDTLVSTESGEKAIGRIEAGERVWAYDFQAGAWRLCEVECRMDNVFEGALITLHLDDGEVTATERHPFWVVQGDNLEGRPKPGHLAAGEDQGFSLSGCWVDSHDLHEGDTIFLKGSGPTVLRRLSIRHGRSPVCNITVRELHTYTVGTLQILVHNASGSGPNAPNTGGGGPQKLPGQWDSGTYPKPSGWSKDWNWGPATGEAEAGWRWFDPKGGEWRFHAPDKWHPQGHWDYNPWDAWNSPWQNIYPPKI